MKKISETLKENMQTQESPHPPHKEEPHKKAKEKTRDELMLEFIKWIYEWSRFADFSIRQKATALLREIGELE